MIRLQIFINLDDLCIPIQIIELEFSIFISIFGLL